MATQRNATVVGLTRASLTLAAAMSLTRVFSGADWVIAVVVAAVVPPVILELAQRRRWHPLLAAALVGVVGFWLAVLVDAGSDTAAGIPTGNALSQFGHDLANSPHVLRSAVVPVHSTAVPGSVLLAFIAVYIAAAATHFVGTRLDAPIGAIGPSVALYVAVNALGAFGWATTTACYAIAIIGYLAALHWSELSARRTWFSTREHRRSRLAAGGAAIGMIIVLVAVVVGPRAPGARGPAWINYRKLGVKNAPSVLSAQSPLVSLKNKLNQDSNKLIFTVDDGQVPLYWRVIALDSFYTPDHRHTDQFGLDEESSVKHLAPPSHADHTQTVTQNVRIAAQEDPHWLPAAYRPVDVDLKSTGVLPGSTTLFLTRNSLDDVSYTVTSEVRTPTADELNAVTMNDLGAQQKDLDLPEGFSEKVRSYAFDLTNDAHTPYEKAKALEDFFQGPSFTYDQTVDLSSSAAALEQFVLEDRRGFCEQFATAFVEMARSIGLPARVAVGYVQGTLANGVWQVKGADAHAWPEVWLGDNIGWYPFEPTKSRANPSTGLGTPQGGGNTTQPTTPATTATPTSKPATAASPPVSNPKKVQVPPPATQHVASHRTAGDVALTGLALIGVLFVIALIALGALAWRAVTRTKRRREDGDTRRRVLGAWSEAVERLAVTGVEPRPSATSLEFAMRHAAAHGAGQAGAPLVDLARLHTAAVYAAEPPSESDAHVAWEHVDAINAVLRETVRASERWTARLRLRRRDRRIGELVAAPADRGDANRNN